ncbi:MAG: molybdopterin molybdotransferase MoeA [Euryarchaeota archaeon]|jgi:molybdopterin molybdotransferase|nr:molybdopterin molybdotransferase MoeA [Euryarchaeota archaeon]
MEMGVTIESAIALTSIHSLPRVVETIPLNDAHGRILGISLHSKVDDPRFDNSAMDGWAVIETDCNTYPVKLKIIGTLQAGDDSDVVVEKGTACRIMTGAPVPNGADSIVMVEDSEVVGDEVIINGKARPNFIRIKGENITENEIGLNSGVLLGPAQLAMAAMMGYADVPVIKPPKIAIIGTGDELVEPGDILEPSQIYESNTTALVGLVSSMGCEPVKYPFVSDDIDQLREIFNQASLECDGILTSGGVSMGEWDLVRRLMEEEGDIKFWRIFIKPGGPPLFGLWNGTPLFGLPGNPVSSQVVFMTVVSPWISNSCGFDKSNGPKLFEKVRVKLLSDAKGTKKKVTLRRLNIFWQNDELVAEVPDNQGSGNLRSMVDCNGLSLLPIGVNGNAGDIVDALWLK